jgi:DNA-binding CsgD family transcriptional regulator
MHDDWVGVVETAYAEISGEADWLRAVVGAVKRALGGSWVSGAVLVELREGWVSTRAVRGKTSPLEGGPTLGLGAIGEAAIRELYFPRAPLVVMHDVRSRQPPHVRERIDALLKGSGFTDGFGLTANPRPTSSIAFYAGCSRRVTLSPSQRRMLMQVALHIEAVVRLRYRPEIVRAVLASDGRLLHREAGAPAAEPLRAAIQGIERALVSRSLDLWPALVYGHLSLVARREGGRRQYLVVENAPQVQAMRTLTGREIDVLSNAARGLPAKLISYALGLSQSTISEVLASATAKMGLISRTELVRIAALLTGVPTEQNGDAPQLTPAEADVLELVTRGLSNAEISAIRNRSLRTIANQVAELLRKTRSPSRRALAARSPQWVDRA